MAPCGYLGHRKADPTSSRRVAWAWAATDAFGFWIVLVLLSLGLIVSSLVASRFLAVAIGLAFVMCGIFISSRVRVPLARRLFKLLDV